MACLRTPVPRWCIRAPTLASLSRGATVLLMDRDRKRRNENPLAVQDLHDLVPAGAPALRRIGEIRQAGQADRGWQEEGDRRHLPSAALPAVGLGCRLMLAPDARPPPPLLLEPCLILQCPLRANMAVKRPPKPERRAADGRCHNASEALSL